MNRRLTRIDELRRDIPPARDLWPAISAAIEADKAAALAPSAAVRRRAAWLPAAGMAAAVGLVALGVLIGRSFTPPGTTPPVVNTPASGSPEMMPAAYRQQRDALLVEVQAKLSAMPEIDRKKVAASLATLRRSINEIEAALGRDPANALLQELLVNSCQEEMRALTAVRDSGSQET
jgi:hypothetical protein